MFRTWQWFVSIRPNFLIINEVNTKENKRQCCVHVDLFRCFNTIIKCFKKKKSVSWWYVDLKETPFAHSLNPRLKSFTTGLHAECSLSGRNSTLMEHLWECAGNSVLAGCVIQNECKILIKLEYCNAVIIISYLLTFYVVLPNYIY